MNSQFIFKNNLKQNEFGNKNNLKSSKYYIDALKYYGYNEAPNKILYPIPIIKYSKTYVKQASLPSLPVQPLNKSIEKYLKAVRPLLNNNEFENTKNIVNNFMQPGGTGEKLQKLLYERSKQMDNWLAQWWLDKVYLEPRYGVPINVNPNISYKRANYKSLNEQLEFATNYICGLIEYKKFIDSQQLPVEKYNNQPLCMDQYFKLFGSCRVPFKNKDLIKIYQSYIFSSKHITVMYKNRIFEVQVVENSSEDALPREDIFSNLKQIVENTKDSDDFSISAFTAENRDIWADAYEKLSKDETNRRNFDSIHNSLFVLCLDDDLKVSKTTDERSLDAAQLIHGNKVFSLNRWYDKTIQVIVGANGTYGLNIEHSLAEALPFANMGDYVLDYMQKINQSNKLTPKSNVKTYQELVFNVPNEIKIKSDEMKLAFFKRIDDLDLSIFQFDSFGKNFPKSQKLSPDAFVQIAMQLAFYKLHKKWANAYESGSLRRFTLGRTDIIRSCSDETVKFLEATTNNKPNSDKSVLLRNAIKSHSVNTNEVLNFESFDRHLMGLKLIASENNLDLPELYKDVAYQRLCYYQISSSQVSSKYDSVCSFGPAVNDGYGICYNILERKFLFGLSAFNSCPQTSTKLFANSLNESLLECQNLLLNNVSSKL